ncbi:hypothetical protein VE03_05194 [Pseudogymnoascus sp. 23342-1-I1]|nr:hypothetical protein VE03_05194 [Pseudogymnoascus sp. 23342-1-I1]
MAPYLGFRGPRLNTAAIWLVTCPAFLCYGYNQGVMGGLLTLDAFVRAFPQMDTLHTTGQEQLYNSNIQGTVVALYTVGGIFGSLACIHLGDVHGRRRIIFAATLVSLLGAILMASSFSLAQFIVARVILGLGTGGYVATVPVWQSELSSAAKRGSDVATLGTFIGTGISIALWIDLGFYFIPGGTAVAWRFPLAFQIVLSLMVLCFVFVFPESPRWLIKVGRLEEARSILAILEDVPEDAETIDTDIAEIQASLDACGTGSIKDMFTMGPQRLCHRAILASAAQTFQQINGINAITFYATTIFEQNLGIDPTKSRILAAAMPLTQPVGGYIASLTIDRLGRRVLMLAGATVMMVTMAILAGTTSEGAGDAALIVAVICLFIFCFMFTIGFAGVTFVYAAEIAPLQLRAAVNSVSTAMVWITNFLLAEVTPVGFSSIKNRYYIVFAATNFCILPLVFFFFPETSGRTLEEIDEVFARSKGWFDPPRIAREMARDARLASHSSDGEYAEKGRDMKKDDERAGHAEEVSVI